MTCTPMGIEVLDLPAEVQRYIAEDAGPGRIVGLLYAGRENGEMRAMVYLGLDDRGPNLLADVDARVSRWYESGSEHDGGWADSEGRPGFQFLYLRAIEMPPI